MSDALILRLDSSDQGTFGQLLLGGRFFCYTGELPWRDNASSVSCVPAAEYTAAITFSPRFGRGLYLLAPTAPRVAIRVHPANLMGDSSKGLKCQLNGCIALGERLGRMDGQKAVLLSQPAVRRLEQYFAGRPFQLEIRDVPGGL